MEYLVRRRLSGKAHYWLSSDTACRMASTGGMNVRRYKVVGDTGGREVCHMCKRALSKIQG